MNKSQTQKRAMFGKIRTFLNDNNSIWAGFARLVTEVAAFLGFLVNIDNEAAKQAAPTTGVTTGKNDFRTIMAAKLVKFARKARVWAHDVNNTTLEALFNVQLSDFLEGSEADAISKATDIKIALNDNIASLGPYNIVGGDVTAIGTAITNFANAKDTPGAAEAFTKSATDALPGLFDKADTSLEIIQDLLISDYSESNPDEVDQFKVAHHIDNIGVHHTGIRADIVYSDGSGVAQGIQMKIIELNKTATSDINGIDEIIKCRAGTYHIQFSGAGIVTKTITIKIKRGQIISLHVEVTKT